MSAPPTLVPARCPSDRPPPDRSAPDRYADAVRARRAELRAAEALLRGGHRAELRSGLAAGRLTASAELAAALAALDREVRHHADHADGHGRAALPERVAGAVDRLAASAGRRWAAVVLPAVRRVAGARGLPVPWSGAHPLTAVLARPPTVAVPAPEPPPGALRAVLVGATAGWRLALLPVAVLPAVGLPVLAGPAAVPLAVGSGLALLGVGVRARRVAADRARLRRWGAEVVAAVRGALETELARRLLEVERLAGHELDDAVTRRRVQVERALRELAPDPAAEPGGRAGAGGEHGVGGREGAG